MGLLTFLGFNSNQTIKDKLKSGESLTGIQKTVKKERNDFNRDFKKIKNNGRNNP